MKVWLLYRDAPASEMIGLYRTRRDGEFTAGDIEGRNMVWFPVCKGHWRSGLWGLVKMKVEKRGDFGG